MASRPQGTSAYGRARALSVCPTAGDMETLLGQALSGACSGLRSRTIISITRCGLGRRRFGCTQQTVQ